MATSILKKVLLHGSLCLIAWLLVYHRSAPGAVYAGWLAGFLGACYLFAAWISYLKTKGSDLGAVFRRRKPVDVPFYLRGSDKKKKSRLTLTGVRHDFDDDGEAISEEEDEGMDAATRAKRDAVARLILAVLLFAASFLG